jgi:hydroxymethylpyrimidine pyrophosphatase-like HAD family hydrolase
MFFSDLDRTLIYSNRFTKEIDTSLVVVEEKEGREISYMTPASYNALQELRKQTTFVPVTARKWDEIMRITFIREQIPPIMVCEVGRVIYRNGKRDAFWDAFIKQVMESSNKMRKESFERFQKEMQSLGYPAWEINEYMLMTKVEGWTEGQKEHIMSMFSWFYERGSLLLIQERKVYLIPTNISKAHAVRYLIHLYNPRETVSAGDADMDVGMFSVTNHSIAPAHHTIEAKLSCPITEKSGIYAGEEILAFAKKKLCD